MATATQPARTTELYGWPTREALEENLREVRRVATTARHVAEETAADAARQISQHPLRAVAGAALIAGTAGLLLGFGAGWFARTRR